MFGLQGVYQFILGPNVNVMAMMANPAQAMMASQGGGAQPAGAPGGQVPTPQKLAAQMRKEAEQLGLAEWREDASGGLAALERRVWGL